MLPEKEARAIIAQVFSALVHLNQPSHRIIHYDLKPANILFDSMGLAKVTDFGLSKVRMCAGLWLGRIRAGVEQQSPALWLSMTCCC